MNDLKIMELGQGLEDFEIPGSQMDFFFFFLHFPLSQMKVWECEEFRISSSLGINECLYPETTLENSFGGSLLILGSIVVLEIVGCTKDTQICLTSKKWKHILILFPSTLCFLKICVKGKE